MSSINSESVYFLLSDLCKHIQQEINPHKAPKKSSGRKLKSLCYEILLKKSLKFTVDTETVCNPLRDLDAQLFELRIRMNNGYNNDERICEDFERFIQYFSEEPYFEEDVGKNILTFLLNLQGSVEEENFVYKDEDLKKSTLLVPGPFTLHANYSKNLYYPKKRVQISKSSYEHFQPLKPLQDYENPYLPRLLFQGDSNKLIKIDQKFGISSQREVTIFSGFVRDTWGSALNLNPFACKFFTNISKVTACLNVQPAYERKKYGNKDMTNITPNVNDIPDENKTFSWNWEHLGTNQLTIAKRFCSEASSALYLDKLVVENSGGTYIAKQVQLKQFIADLKALVIGIQSDIFKHDEYIIFHMLPDITIPGVTPAVIESFVSDFLVCGTCYKRLQVMISKRNYKLMFDGFIFKTLCNAVGEYLMIFRNFVISFECNSLSELHCKMRNMMKQIVALSHTLAIHMDVDVNIKPPMGSPQFLGYLYREITQVTQNNIVMLLVYILKRCCHVYFKHLQKWIFYGVLDDPCNELFICFIDHYRPYTKYFFDKAYFVRRESVPGFFQGYEDQILQCGKYAMLLKAFKPNHPLFDIEYPSISVCLSFEEVQDIADSCKKYAERAREVCGKPITPSDIFYKRLEKKREFFKIVSEKSKKNMDKWEAEQKASAALRVAEKKKRLEEIHIQLQESKERKLAEKKANIEFELKLLKQSDELENKRLIHEQLEIQKRVEYYQELNDIIEERKQRIDKECVIAKSSNDGLLLGTPVSSGTDFESCWGEDPESGYEDCVSNEFLEKFQQNEDELVKIVTSEHDEKENVYNLDTGGDNDNNMKTIKKSASDYFNSNEIAPPDSNVISELQQNRTKILGSNIAYCFDNTQSNKVKVNKSLTEEAEKIKCKVLIQEFGYDISNNMNETADIINSNHVQNKDEISQQKPMISELQKNRQKMMHDDIFAEFNNDQADTKTLKLDLNSELAKNRRRVLESEFHILTGENNSAETTPMSTTSDSCLFDEKIDENINGNKTSANLKVCIDTVKYLDVEKMHLDIPTAIIDETTPECALNTAGIKARNGFDFRIEGNKTELIKSKATANSKDYDVDELQIEFNDNIPNKLARDNLSPYKRCEELVKSNFKCRPLSPYFSLNKPQQESNTEHVQMLQERKKQLNCLSAITLTEFLQKSVTIPLSTHMEIMNSEIMRIFLDDLDIIGHFKSLRNYFFLMDGEFGSFICDGLITKLEKGATPNELLNYQMLHTILDNALGSSIMGSDKNSENLSFIVTELPEKFDLYSSSVLDNLSLSYRIAWPVNLILNPETLDQYANIFKYLMKVRRISWLLEESYHMLKEVVKKNGNGILQSPQYRHVQQIRHKFFHFVHALRNHITSSALQASWKTFKDDLISAKTIEDLYRKHTTYIKRVLFLCMLNRRSVEFFNTIENIFKVSLRFYRNLKSREWKKLPDNEHFTHSRYEKLLNDELEFEKLIKYTIYLGNKIVRHGYQEEIGEFINLINYNYYYVVDV